MIIKLSDNVWGNLEDIEYLIDKGYNDTIKSYVTTIGWKNGKSTEVYEDAAVILRRTGTSLTR